MLKSLIRVSGIIIMFFIVVNFYWFFFVAMFMGNGSVNIYFNQLNEGSFETVMYAILLPIILISFLLELKLYDRERKQWRKMKNGKKKVSVRDTKGSISSSYEQ